ncbi:MAG: thiamine phosphate synthase, partial [Usitatibacteraceae bacterium]
ADYIAFGSFFPSSTKPDAARAELSLISEAKAQWAVPVVAIGGITPNNAYQLLEAGVDAIAVIAGLFGAADIEQRAREFSNLFKIESHVYQ